MSPHRLLLPTGRLRAVPRRWRRLALAPRAALAALAVLAFGAAQPLHAQAASADSLDARITDVIGAVSSLRYDDAIAGGRALLAAAPQMRPAQEVLLRSAIAAAFYPEEADVQQADSAIAQLAAAIRVQPDMALPVELSWVGLDSLLDVARRRTFAVVVTADAEQELVGPGGRGGLSLRSSRPAVYTLRTALLGSATQVQQAQTREYSTAAVLLFRALDGNDILLAPGDYDATIVAVDARGDSTIVRRRLSVGGQPLLRIAPPAFDSTQLRPEVTKPPFLRTALTALGFATATFVIGSLGGDDGEFGDDFEPDSRASLVALGMLGAGAGTYWLDKGKRDPAAVAFNATLRENHRRAVESAALETQSRINGYRVIVRLLPETR